jgi:hypothetical protein
MYGTVPYSIMQRMKPCSMKYLGHLNPRSGILRVSVADTDPHKDPDVLGPTGCASGSVVQNYGSGSGSFQHQAKIVRKTLIPTVL